MQRSQIVAGCKSLQYIGCEYHALVELLASVHHAVTNCIDLIKRLDNAILAAGKYLEYELYTYRVLGDLLLYNNLVPILIGQLKERPLHAYLLNATLCYDIVLIHVKQLVLD